MKKTAVITGADGDMGSEITRAVALQGYHVVMVCHTRAKGEKRRDDIIYVTRNVSIEVVECDLSSLSSVVAATDNLLKRIKSVDLLMNNAAVITTHQSVTDDGIEHMVATNYVGPYLFTRRLVPLMHGGSRIVNMLSCTFRNGKITPDFFTHGRSGRFNRIAIYSNTKLAMWLFTRRLSALLLPRGISVNAADPGIVSTKMLRMKKWFDPLTDILFRPFIRTIRQGADTAERLLLGADYEGLTGCMFRSGKECRLKNKYLYHPQTKQLWDDTERLIREKISCDF